MNKQKLTFVAIFILVISIALLGFKYSALQKEFKQARIFYKECKNLENIEKNLFNGTGQGFKGGSQAFGGVDDYNNADSPPIDRYSKGWTACTSGNNYCGTGLASADAKDNSTGLIWSLPCSGVDCSSFSDSNPSTYAWYNIKELEANISRAPSSLTPSQLCSSGSHGQTGWFLPHQKQLMQAYINGAYGNLEAPGVSRDYYSDTTSSWRTSDAWSVNLSSGITDTSLRAYSAYVRCVRPANTK